MVTSTFSAAARRSFATILAVVSLGGHAYPLTGPLDDPSELGPQNPPPARKLLSVPPAMMNPVNELHVMSVVRESNAVCDFARAGRRAAMGTPLAELLRFEQLQAIKPEMGLVTAGAVEFAASHSLRVCFDQRLKGTPYSSALHLPSGTIALNPEPPYFNFPAVQELALMDALEHMGTLVKAAKAGHMKIETVQNVQLIRMDPDKPDASKREFSPELTIKFPPPLRQDAPWQPVTKPILPQGPSYKT